MDYNEEYKALWRKCARHPKTAEDWSRRAPAMHKEPFLENSYTRTFLERVNLQGCESVLDLGCGVGNLLIPLLPKLHRGYGVDYAPGMLEEARRNAGEAGVSNVEWIEADWQHPAEPLPQADIVLASRSLDAEDMQAALMKLDGLARRRVYLTYRVGRSYLDDELLNAVGRHVEPRPDHLLLLHILLHMHIRGTLDYIDTAKTAEYETFDALRRRVEWTLGALNTDEADGLGRFFETLPKAENGDRLHTHRITWAFITWEKP